MRNPKDVLLDRVEKVLEQNEAYRIKEFDITGWSLVDLKYDNLSVQNQSPVALQTSEFTNDTTVTDTQTFSVDKETTDSFTWSITEGLEVSTEFTVNVPLVGGAKTSVKLSLSSTQAQSVSRTRKWLYSAEIPVPAHSKVSVMFSVLEGSVNTPFTATIQAQGTVWVEWKAEGSWFYCGGDIDNMIEGDYCFPDASFWQVSASGVFTGVDATSYIVKSKQKGEDQKQIDASPIIEAAGIPLRVVAGKSIGG